jgi:hypothetical protein
MSDERRTARPKQSHRVPVGIGQQWKRRRERMVRITVIGELDELDKKLLASIKSSGNNGKRAHHLALELDEYPATINALLNMLEKAQLIRLERGHKKIMVYPIEA